MTINFYKFIGCTEEKKCAYIFLGVFPTAGNNNEKKNLCRTVFGLLPKLYCEKKENFCIARKALYCDIVALDVQERRIVLQVEWVLKIVLQYNFCIVENKA